MTTIMNLNPDTIYHIFGQNLSLIDIASLAHTTKKLACFMQDKNLLLRYLPCKVQLDKRNVVCLMIQSSGLPEPTLKFLSRLVEKAKDFPWRSKAHEEIVKTVFDTLFNLYPSKLFPTQQADETLQQIFLQLAKEVEPDPNWSNPLSNYLHKWKISHVQYRCFVTLMPLKNLRYYHGSELHEICNRYRVHQLSKSDLTSFHDYFKTYRRAFNILSDSDGITSVCVINTISIEFFEFYLQSQSPDNLQLGTETIKAFNTIASHKNTYEKLQVLVNWYLKNRVKMDVVNESANLLVILSIANNLMKKMHCTHGPLHLQLQNREIHGSKKSPILLTRSELQSWIPEKYISWQVFTQDVLLSYREIRKEDLEIRQFFKE